MCVQKALTGFLIAAKVQRHNTILNLDPFLRNEAITAKCAQLDVMPSCRITCITIRFQVHALFIDRQTDSSGGFRRGPSRLRPPPLLGDGPTPSRYSW